MACGRNREGGTEQSAPSSTVIPIAIGLANCPDIAVCDRACDGGNADSCRRLAVSYALGRDTDKDETRATALYERSCSLGDSAACLFAGQMYEFAHGVPADPAKAAALYRLSCDRQLLAGCYNLAIMYERGRGVPPDQERAAELYNVACAGGAQEACDRESQLGPYWRHRDATSTPTGADR
jgi:TPR repeat protein